MTPLMLKWNMTTKPISMEVWYDGKLHFSGKPSKARKIHDELRKYEEARSK
jgi:hypothetical protein